MLVTAAVAFGAAVALPGTASAQPPAEAVPPAEPKAAHEAHPHNLDGPFSKKQRIERQAALTKLAQGEGDSGQARTFTSENSKVMKLGKGKYVELAREKTDKIFTILIEFGDKVDPEYGGDPGPAHNQIAEPDRKKDNSTYWKEDFSREHFHDIYFGEGEDSLKTYYEKQSSGRYSVEGTVSDWVKVDYNEARYGSNYCGETTCPTVWDAVRDGVNTWVEGQEKAGKTDEEIKEQLAAYDTWDRYDYDFDGDFNETDGYIDHFQFVHAGEDESAGGGAQGEDAIWAHRWYAYGTDVGASGPSFNKAGGTQIGDTGVWVGDYTVQPENGGLGVFAHEYGHDLGLPDHYDTTGTGENSVGFWSLMSSGSWLNKGEDAIGDSAGDMNAWDKFQLGWLDYNEAKAGSKSTHTLGYQSFNTRDPQALLVRLPEKDVTTTVTEPAEGAMQWWSGSGDDLSNTLTRSVDLTGATSAKLDLQAWYDIEEGYDYLYAEVSTDGGENWTPIPGTAGGEPIGDDGGDRPAISGVSGEYVPVSYPMDAYAGKKVDFRFRYQTDGGVAQKGFTADAMSLTVDGEEVFTDGAETEAEGWSADGFSRIEGSFTKSYPHFYIAENRQHVGYDKSLATGPYNFGWPTDHPDRVERYAYETGLLLWYWDSSQADNNVGVHPGEGLILPIDAHAEPLRWKDDSLVRGRIQAYDSPFSMYPTQGITLHKDGVRKRFGQQPAVPVFDDRNGTYWYETNPQAGVRVPDTGTTISVVKQPAHGKTITVKVGRSK